MTPITATIKLHSCHQYQGTYINALVLEHKGNNYHLYGGTRDTIHVFTESLGIYVLTINKCLGYIRLNSYMAPEPDPINTVFLHNNQEIEECLRRKLDQMKPEIITKRLSEYLY